MQPEVAKFQFEIRYTNILNFGPVAREIISPYLKLASGFRINNQGLLEEEIKLDFDLGNFSIDVRWDKMVILSENNMLQYNDENSNLGIAFSILDKLSNSSSFGSIKNYILLATCLISAKDTHSNSLDRFRDKFFVKNCFQHFKPSDYAVIFEKEEDEKLTTLTLGPYSNKDLVFRNIKSIGYVDTNSENDINGFMVDIKIFEPISKIKHKTFVELTKQVLTFSEILKEI